jgi:hypothetical protein
MSTNLANMEVVPWSLTQLIVAQTARTQHWDRHLFSFERVPLVMLSVSHFVAVSYDQMLVNCLTVPVLSCSAPSLIRGRVCRLSVIVSVFVNLYIDFYSFTSFTCYCIQGLCQSRLGTPDYALPIAVWHSGQSRHLNCRTSDRRQD